MISIVKKLEEMSPTPPLQIIQSLVLLLLEQISGIVIPSSCANFLLITDLPVEKTLTGVSAGFCTFQDFAQSFYLLPHQGRVGQLQLMPNHLLLPCSRTWVDWFLADWLLDTTVEKADAMVLSIGTQIASTLLVITLTVEAISFVEGTANVSTVKPAFQHKP